MTFQDINIGVSSSPCKTYSVSVLEAYPNWIVVLCVSLLHFCVSLLDFCGPDKLWNGEEAGIILLVLS